MKFSLKKSISVCLVVIIMLVSTCSFVFAQDYTLSAEGKHETISSGEIYCSFNITATVDREWWPKTEMEISFSGESRTTFTRTPALWRKFTVYASDTFTVTGVNLSASFSTSGGGVGGEQKGNDYIVTYPPTGTYNGTYHKISDVRCTTSPFSESVSVKSSATYQLGIESVLINAYDKESVVLTL